MPLLTIDQHEEHNNLILYGWRRRLAKTKTWVLEMETCQVMCDIKQT